MTSWPSRCLRDSGRASELQICPRRLGGKSDSSTSWIHAEVLGFLMWLAKLYNGLCPFFPHFSSTERPESRISSLTNLWIGQEIRREGDGHGWGKDVRGCGAFLEKAVSARQVYSAQQGFHFLGNEEKCKPGTLGNSPGVCCVQWTLGHSQSFPFLFPGSVGSVCLLIPGSWV